MKKLAIVGGGITGMSAAIYNLYARKNKDIDTIHIYSSDLGGEFLKGGLKIINNTFFTRFFIGNFLDLKYTVQPIMGAVITDYVEMHQYPLYFRTFPDEGIKIQKEYWNKTRNNNENFNKTCMNDPWNNLQTQFKLVPELGIKSVFDMMKNIILSNSSIKLFNVTVDEDKIKNIISEYDEVIYTIPFQLLFNSYGIEYPKSEYASLNIVRVKIPEYVYDKIWYDYLYTPYFLMFHRMSKVNVGDEYFVDLEINNTRNINTDELREQVVNIINFQNKIIDPNELFDFRINKINIKGQIQNHNNISTQVNELLPKNVILLGRYAEWNSRVTWDKVLEKCFNNTTYNL